MSEFSNNKNNKLSSLRLKVTQGESLTDIDLSNCGLEEFPLELFATAHSLETLNLGGNLLKALPADMSPFTKLRILFFAQNRFTEYPVQLNQLPALRMVSFKSNSLKRIDEEALTSSITWLILTDNELSSIPRSIGKLTHLRKCMMAGNKLTSLPEEMAGCQELELLRLAANDLIELPSWLLKLPKLSWLAFAGNPLGSARTTAVAVDTPSIPWSQLEVLDKVGEGASGLVYRARWHRLRGNSGDCSGHTGQEGKEDREVAVKIFKAGTTSDGLPENEMEITAAVGCSHPNFVGALGVLHGAPQQQMGLVLPLIASNFSILGGPPSFASVTRDTFPADRKFSLTFVLKLLLQVASACWHLHKHGIMHGDLYAHNILCSADGTPLLTDFGAASFVKGRVGAGLHSSVRADLLEKLEVRAFGCLVDDMLGCMYEEEEKNDHVEVTGRTEVRVRALLGLRELQNRCFLPDVEVRPDFATIFKELEAIAAISSDLII